MLERKRRTALLIIVVLIISITAVYDGLKQKSGSGTSAPNPISAPSAAPSPDKRAINALGELEIKGRAPRTGYARAQFDESWEQVGACDIRNHILKRDMTVVITVSDSDCTVLQGTLDDPYTGKTINFSRGPASSDDVQIDHVVALSDAWQKGAQQLETTVRQDFANDPLNLLAVDGPANQNKGDGDAATWLPPNKPYRCRYIARQIAVKIKYRLWVTQAEKEAMAGVLGSCPDQSLPLVGV